MKWVEIMFSFKAAIFDLDGTLIDSLGVWERIDIAFLEKRKLNPPESYVNDICGLSFRQTAEYLISLFSLDELAEDLMKEWNDMAAHEYANTVFLKPHAKEYLMSLHSRGIKIATATSLPNQLSEPALKNNGIYHLFDAFCSTDETGKSKEQPDVYLLAAKKLNIPPNECIVFEDILPGIKSAKAAGMKAFCVHDQYSCGIKEDSMNIADGYIYDFNDAPLPTPL